ncbi:MAG TPA: sulfurtransferase TusA family protein [Mucilaginibacter sp.]
MKADKELKAAGLACINLTPNIKQAISAMKPDEVLKVYSDDQASRLGVPAWCRLTGHTLLEMEELDATQILFYIKKKNL